MNRDCLGHVVLRGQALPRASSSHIALHLDKFQRSGARQPARVMSVGLAARQLVQPARHLSATLSAGLAIASFAIPLDR